MNNADVAMEKRTKYDCVSISVIVSATNQMNENRSRGVLSRPQCRACCQNQLQAVGNTMAEAQSIEVTARVCSHKLSQQDSQAHLHCVSETRTTGSIQKPQLEVNHRRRKETKVPHKLTLWKPTTDSSQTDSSTALTLIFYSDQIWTDCWTRDTKPWFSISQLNRFNQAME